MVRLAENAGVAGGRNAGVQACTGDVVLFLDDDGWYPDPGVGAYIADRFADDRELAVLSFRVVHPEGGPSARWHVPRLRAGDPERSSLVTTFAGGACAIRRSAYLEAGGLPAVFFYAHEETDLAWRLLGLGYRIEYDAAAQMCHHALPNARHATFFRLDGRNRVLLARRNLPWFLAALYLTDWFALTVLRERSAECCARLAGRLRRRLANGPRAASADVPSHSVADDPGRASAGDLSFTSQELVCPGVRRGPRSSARLGSSQ